MEMIVPSLAKGRLPLEPEKLIRREPVDPGTFKRMIRQMGLKVTQQRMAILESLSAGRAHVTAQEVYEAVNVKYPEIGFATVYRFLRKMAEQKLVTEVRMGGLPARYELTPRRHHDHLTCVQCGQIVEFESQQIETLQELVAKEHNFRLTHHVLELYGICPRCQTE
ncbi:MAG TPA: Fur family transcriptional regulator [Bdellovibrionales bacterium]|nr:Fur family transcriptional regulator [Bdellovibrionales bacterium]